VIALIDYHAGNLTSVRKALATVGAEVVVPSTPEELDEVAGVIVPGVGHFGATRALAGAWTDAILARVGEGRPLLGICLGMQWLFEGSDEAPDCAGLGVLGGRCRRLTTPPGNERLKIPHVGWNSLDHTRETSILKGLPSHSHVYFTHSYAAPVTDACVAASMHADCFSAVVERDNVFGVQFHPEKSQRVGLRILENFVALVRAAA